MTLFLRTSICGQRRLSHGCFLYLRLHGNPLALMSVLNLICFDHSVQQQFVMWCNVNAAEPRGHVV